MKYAYLRTNGQWISQFVNPMTGKRIRKSLGDDIHEAQRNLTKLMLEYGLSPNPDGKTYNVLMGNGIHTVDWHVAYKEYYDTHISNFTSKHKAYLESVLKKLNSFCNIPKVGHYKYKHIQTFLNYNKGSVSASSINKYIVTLRKFFNFCKMMGWIEKNPVDKIERLEEIVKTPYVFDEDELHAIFSDPCVYTKWWEFLLETGIRACDAIAFTKSQNFIEQDRLYCTFREAKNRKVFTKLPLSKRAEQIVRDSGEILFPKGYKWLNRNSHYNGFLVQSRKELRKRVGDVNHPNITDIKHHTFRHTFAVTNLNNGMPKGVLQTLLGHSSMATTERHYANWMTDETLAMWI